MSAAATGGRLSTILQRLPFLPAADAIVCESGGRIFYPGDALPTAGGWLQEDAAWREGALAAVAGPPGQDGIPPDGRVGELWQQYRRLKGLGFGVDALSYTTAFRVRCPAEQSAPLQEALASLPAELSTNTNLGAVDVYPATSGKANAARHVMRRFGAPDDGSSCVFMCDDDNDLELAFAVRRAYLPGITAESVQQAVDASPEQFYVAQSKGVWGTEEVLEQLIQLAIAPKSQS
jgi:hydroxymethylpyrimidine pyrophosphatase-like HAD family hydrolase